MSIPPDSEWRGAAAFLSQPVTDERAAQHMAEAIYYFNTRSSDYVNLSDIEYRSSDGDLDLRTHVFRWDFTPYDVVFRDGFQPRRQNGTSESMYYNLERYVNTGGRPLDIRRTTTHAFVSTTISSSWNPRVDLGTSLVYRYEIYAPGGILVNETLGEHYRFRRQAEVAFPAGIAPQYVRSAQLFELTSNGIFISRSRVDTILFMNTNFSPQSHPERRIRLRYPVSNYRDENNETQRLVIQEFPERQNRSVDANDDLMECNIECDMSLLSRRCNETSGRRRLLSVDLNDHDLIEYYTEGVTLIDNYIDSAFRSTRPNEVYMFIQGEYVLVDYAPGTTGDKIIQGPKLIGDGFPSLVGTNFAEYGIDAGFSCYPKSEAIIFSGNLCARIDYAPGTNADRILEGPKTIRQMFPFFKGTEFENGVDAAFESSDDGDAILFKGSEYAALNYEKPELHAIRPITYGFECLRGTEFARDIGAAFASHKRSEAYLFKGNSYIRLTSEHIVGGPKEIVPNNWPSLKDFVPRKNIGFDVYEYVHEKPPEREEAPERVHDEL